VTVQSFLLPRALGPRALALGCVVLITMAASVGAAEAPGGASLQKGRAQWDKGSLENAEPLYRDALEKGGLAPNEVLEGYVRLGAIRAAIGKKDGAVAAFRAASILDASFAVPSEAGPKGASYAEKAKKDTARIGSIQLSMKAPKETPPGKPFKVTATLDAPHLQVVQKIALVAKDGTSGKESTLDLKPEESVEFEVPQDVTLPGAAIVVRVDALDSHQNRLASVEQKVHVPNDDKAVAGGGAGKGGGAGVFTPPPNEEKRKGGSFWSTPWPYVIGGVAIAGAGAAVYFGTRPPADVSVGQVEVRTR